MSKVDFLLDDADGNGAASPGDALLYEIQILNSGDGTAAGITFFDAPDPNTSLVAGSVYTSQGSITLGNTPGDTTVEVLVGDIAPLSDVIVGFQVRIHDPLPPGTVQVANQGYAEGPSTGQEPTDDPDTPEDDDPTITPLVIPLGTLTPLPPPPTPGLPRVYLPFIVVPMPPPSPTLEGIRHPKDIDVNSQTHVVYVAARADDLLYAIDGPTMTILGTTQVCDEPWSVAVNPTSNKVYVSCHASDQIAVVDGSALNLEKLVDVGPGPAYIDVNSSTNRIYVALHELNGVAVIDGANDTVIDYSGAGGAGVFGIAVNTTLNRVYVSSRDTNTIATIDGLTNNVIDSQSIQLTPARSVPYELEYSETTGKLYAIYGAQGTPNSVWVFEATVDGLMPIDSIGVGEGGAQGGGGIVSNPSVDLLFITNSADNSVTVIDGVTDLVVDTLQDPAVHAQDPFGIGVDTALNVVYWGNRGSDSVTRQEYD